VTCRCGYQAPPEFAFCPKCGARLPAPCPSCGAVSPPDFAFCPRCGARLAAPGAKEPAGPRAADHGAPASEGAGSDRRPVTVLFADLSGFTALGERLDPEDIRLLQGDLFQLMASAVEHYEGFVEKFVGDAMMAVFGAPAAHEDDPERALRAALAMRERVAALNGRWAGRLGRTLALHTGIHTGPVVAGTLGSTPSAAYAVTGDTVNTASRLQTAAEAGQILASRATYRLTQHAFEFESLGDLAMKGKAGPVAAYRLVGALATPRPARGLEAHGLVAPLVGRDEELGQLLAAFQRMLGGRTQVVSLIGEAGAGKSRLQAEFLMKLESDGHAGTIAVRRAICSSLGEKTYGVLASLLQEAYGVSPDDSLEAARRKLESGLEGLGVGAEETARIAAVLGYVLGLGQEEPRMRHLEPEQLKRQIFLAARALFEARLAASPLLIIVEDLHWADPASLELLRFLVDRLPDRRLMLLLAYRPTVDAAIVVSSRATHTSIRIAPLSASDSDALLASLFGPVERCPERLHTLIVERAGGNPFYLEEMVRNLIAKGVLVREDSGWTCTADAAIVDVPVTIQGLLLSRLDRLSAVPRRVIQEAAVIGTSFDQRLLGMVSGDQASDAVLEALEDAELLAEAPHGGGGESPGPDAGRRYRFTHALVQEVAYENLLVRRRAELHTRVGQALEALRGTSPQRLEDLEALGHHWSLSTDKPRGARYLVAAGDWARAIHANVDAIRHYQRALETLNECGGCDEDRFGVRERLGDLLGPSGEREAALEHYEAVRAGCERTNDRCGQARVDRKMGALYWAAGDRERAFGCFQAGLDLLQGQREHIELAHLYQEMGRLAFRGGDNPCAIEWAERALAQAERLAGRAPAPDLPEAGEERKEAAAAVAHAYNTLGVAQARLGKMDEAVAHIERSVAVAEEADLLQAACRGFANLGVLYSTLNPGRAIETCARGLELAKKIGDLGFQSRLYANLAVAYCALTNRCDEDGLGAAQAAVDLDRRLGQLDHLAVPLIVLGQIYQCHGEAERALTHYREALTIAEEIGEPQLLFPCYDGLATLYLEMGDDQQAEQQLLKAQAVCERAGLEPDALAVLPFLD
jgi:adenylate cyclase